jgi:hypothetical protein
MEGTHPILLDHTTPPPPIEGDKPDGTLIALTKLLETHYGAPEEGEGGEWLERVTAEMRRDFGDHPMLLLGLAQKGGGGVAHAQFANRTEVKRAARIAARRKRGFACIKSYSTGVRFTAPTAMLNAASEPLEEITCVIRMEDGGFTVSGIKGK